MYFWAHLNLVNTYRNWKCFVQELHSKQKHSLCPGHLFHKKLSCSAVHTFPTCGMLPASLYIQAPFQPYLYLYLLVVGLRIGADLGPALSSLANLVAHCFWPDCWLPCCLFVLSVPDLWELYTNCYCFGWPVTVATQALVKSGTALKICICLQSFNRDKVKIWSHEAWCKFVQ